MGHFLGRYLSTYTRYKEEKPDYYLKIQESSFNLDKIEKERSTQFLIILNTDL